VLEVGYGHNHYIEIILRRLTVMYRML